MNKKILLGIAACCTAVCMCQGYIPSMEANTESGGVPGQVDSIYDPAEGVGIGDASMVLQHYAQTAAGMDGIINDFISFIGADVNGDDIINLEDATVMLSFYAAYSAGLEVYSSDYFEVYDVYDAAFAAYRDIISDFLSQCGEVDMLDPAFDIAYIDDNMIPELILSPSTVHATGGCTIYTYLNGKAVLLGENCFGEFGEVKYLPYESIIVNDMAYTGLRYISIHNLEQGKLTEIMNASIDYLNSKYTLNGSTATESQVNSALSYYENNAFTAGRRYTSLDQF